MPLMSCAMACVAAVSTAQPLEQGAASYPGRPVRLIVPVPPGGSSDGMARVLAQLWPGEAGQTLLLDEPTSMLDPLHQHTTLQAVREFANRGAAVLVILHDLNLAARYCDRLLLLEGGRPVALDTPAQVLRPEPLKAVFGLEVLVQQHPERGHPLIIAR